MKQAKTKRKTNTNTKTSSIRYFGRWSNNYQQSCWSTDLIFLKLPQPIFLPEPQIEVKTLIYLLQPQRPQVHSLRQRSAQRPQALQHPAQLQLWPQGCVKIFSTILHSSWERPNKSYCVRQQRHFHFKPFILFVWSWWISTNSMIMKLVDIHQDQTEIILLSRFAILVCPESPTRAKITPAFSRSKSVKKTEMHRLEISERFYVNILFKLFSQVCV